METPETPAEILFDDFLKVDIRSGTITKSERVEKSKKLLKLEVYFGPEIGHRTILAGIAKHYDADAIVGQRVAAVVNLAPREMMGHMSHGMLLAGQGEDGTVTLVQCFSVPDGARLG
jgi:methionyl-tRNA synthetase